jgi:hypothetical protein
MFGLDSYTRAIEFQAGGSASLHYCADIKVKRDLSLEVNRNLPTPAFTDYEEYKRYLLEITVSVLGNLHHENRPIRYEPMSTVSTGYDSPAVASLASATGCREAMTFLLARDFLTSRSNEVSRNDSGVEIAKSLGMQAIELDADAYRAMDTFPEAEFLATGYGGEDVIFAGTEALLSERVLLTGYHGDRVWSLNPDHVSVDLKRGDPSGASLLEFRLRTGFVHLPVAFIGAGNHRAIWIISNSAEMQPWRIGGSYDRPIPRRIAEEMGVPRALFGQTKKAASHPFQSAGMTNADIRCLMSPRSLLDFEEFVRSHPFAQAALHRGLFAPVGRVLGSRKIRVASGLWPPVRRIHTRLAWRYLKPIDYAALSFPWAVERTVARYAQAWARFDQVG